jgi:hypothetical protein
LRHSVERFPELARIYYEKGAARLLTRLEEVFLGCMQRGELRKANSRRAAEQFIDLIRGDLQLRALLGVEHQTAARPVIRAGIGTFLRAYAATI